MRRREPELGSGTACRRLARPRAVVRSSDFPRAGGAARLYRVPSLDPFSWTAEDKLPPVDRVVGADPEQGLVVRARPGKHNLVALDLDTRRVRPYIEQVRTAALGPDGALYAVDTGSTVTQTGAPRAGPLPGQAAGQPRELHATMNGSLLARVGGNGAGARGARAPTGSRRRPRCPAADRAELLRRPRRRRGRHRRRDLSIPRPERAPLSSASPATRETCCSRRRAIGSTSPATTTSSLVLDRFSGDALERDRAARARPRAPRRRVRAVAAGPAGRPATRCGSSTSAAAGYAARSPPSGAATCRPSPRRIRCSSAAARTSSRSTSARDGIPGDRPGEGRRRRFLAAARLAPGAGRSRPPPTADSGALAAGADTRPGRAASVYLQVSSSQNPTWANELGDKLKGAGLPASVLPPARSDEAYRVVLGPYATREQAEETGKKIGMPSFVVTPQDNPER